MDAASVDERAVGAAENRESRTAPNGHPHAESGRAVRRRCCRGGSASSDLVSPGHAARSPGSARPSAPAEASRRLSIEAPSPSTMSAPCRAPSRLRPPRGGMVCVISCLSVDMAGRSEGSLGKRHDIQRLRPVEEEGVLEDDSDDSQKAVFAGSAPEHSVTMSEESHQLEVAPEIELVARGGLGGALSNRSDPGAGGQRNGLPRLGSRARRADCYQGSASRSRARAELDHAARAGGEGRARHSSSQRLSRVRARSRGRALVRDHGARNGGTLRSLLHQGARKEQRPLAERLTDARAICAGLAAIHAVGIVHRDVTPQNVLRMEDGRLVISDFGLAIELSASTTMNGGTPNYMPPETLLGQRGDRRSDVWQLGVILHEILFGWRPVFDQNRRQGHPEVAAAVGGHAGRGGAGAAVRRLFVRQPGVASVDRDGRGGAAGGGGRGAAAVCAPAELVEGEEGGRRGTAA